MRLDSQVQLNVLRRAEFQIALHLECMGTIWFVLLRCLGLRRNIKLSLNFAAQFFDMLELERALLLTHVNRAFSLGWSEYVG